MTQHAIGGESTCSYELAGRFGAFRARLLDVSGTLEARHGGFVAML
jgi:hypothetical protein